ncbi:hypothetical protein KOR34_22520 [Posidoniimonas corsicana]|uniref:BBP7 family outer membrane beta-barrel protein n=1 Tax=Posidoniimonas corsicana TaxID=1938618 RepID=A0A5C5VF86_9BACT|nr:BBP7 family outer membrane beta-barrel protein [Posidoniimonas corsicana]TWT37304.1 hypothetical protein KOR34_22520 [Posidoniimonas corsicana]
MLRTKSILTAVLLAAACLAPARSNGAETTELAAEPLPTSAPAGPAAYQIPPAYGCTGCAGDARFAQFAPDPALRRLGPHPGACEVDWHSGRLWFKAEYLAWATKGADFPSLLTTGDAATPAADAGALDQPDTVTLFGGSKLHDDFRSGGRFTVGLWHCPEQLTGVEATLFGIDGRDIELELNSDDYPVLARPYTDAVGGDEDSLLIAYPGLLAGSTRIDADLELLGGEVMLRQAVMWRTQGRIDILAGYRHGYLNDQLVVRDTSVSLNAGSGYFPGTEIYREDLFRTKNYFHGGQIGLATRLWRGCWSLSLTTKAAYGGTRTRSTISGDTTVVTDPGGIPVFTHNDGGLLGQPTNNDFREFNDESFIGELGVTLERQIGTHTRVGLGYTFFYWDSVVRLAPLIDTNVNPTQLGGGALVGPAVPAFTLSRSDFWAQGLNASFEYQW